MVINPKKSPYKGLGIFLIVMILPSLVITALLYAVISMHQSRFGVPLNWATAKIFGCGAGLLFHMSCWITGAFSEDYQAVKTRLKELTLNLSSPRLALSCYWDDVKTLGMAFWIDAAVIGLNAGIFVDAILDYLALRGF